MFRRILVPLDGSERAERALTVAAAVARASGGTLTLLEVVPIPLTYTGIYSGPDVSAQVIDGEMKEATDYLSQLKHSEVLGGISTNFKVEVGTPASMILDEIQTRNIDLVVMNSHGRTGIGRWVIGSVAEHCARHARAAVLLLREPEAPATTGAAPMAERMPERVMRVLVPLDTSPLAERALEPAAQLVSALTPANATAALHLVLVVDPLDAEIRRAIPQSLILDAARGYLARTAERLSLEWPRLTVTWSTSLNSDAAEGIVRVAELGDDTEGAGPPTRCDLIAMSTHGRTGLNRWTLGSVAERVLHATKLPILLVHAAEEAAPAAHGKVTSETTAR